MFVICIILVVLNSCLLGCFDQQPKESKQKFVALSSDAINIALSSSLEWLYQQSQNTNASYLINDSTGSFFLPTYEAFSFQLLLSSLAQTNLSFLDLHECALPKLILNIRSNDSNFTNVKTLLESILLLHILLASPYYERYEEEARIVYSQLAEHYPYPDIISLYQRGEKSFVCHFCMAELSYCFLFYYDKTQNVTSFEIARQILINTTFLFENISTNPQNVLYLSFYLSSYEWMDRLLGKCTFEPYIFKTAETLSAMQDKQIDYIGSFRNLTRYGNVFPEILLELILIDAITTGYMTSIAHNKSEHVSQHILKTLILGCYHATQLQMNSDVVMNHTGGFPHTYANTLPSILATVKAYLFFIHVRFALVDKDPYLFVYNCETGELYEAHPEEQQDAHAVWVALFIGTICSILCIGVIFFLVNKKHL